MRLLAAAVPTVIAVACGSVALEQAAGVTVEDATATERVVDTGATAASEPVAAAAPVEAADPADPTVEPGTCAVVVYTPPTASAVRVGELCVPLEPTGEVVVLVHGGGGYEGEPADTAAWRDIHLASGRTTFTIEYALVDPADDSAEALWPLAEQNVKAAVQFVRMDDTLAVDEVVIHGFSAGARLGAIIATTGDDPAFAGDELWPGVSDAVDGAILFYGYYDGYQFYEDDYYGTAVPAAAVAIEEADADDPAVLLVHGTGDGLVPVAQSVDFAAAVDAAGGHATLVLIAGANHGFDGYGSEELSDAGQGLLDEIDTYLATLGLVTA